MVQVDNAIGAGHVLSRMSGSINDWPVRVLPRVKASALAVSQRPPRSPIVAIAGNSHTTLQNWSRRDLGVRLIDTHCLHIFIAITNPGMRATTGRGADGNHELVGPRRIRDDD
jgi:hypothetical protein